MPKRYWYVILTYITMQLSGAVFAPILMAVFSISIAAAATYWSIISFIIGLVVVLILLKPDMQTGSARNASSIGKVIGWSILGFFLAYFAQGIAVMIEMELLGIDPGSENTQMIMDISRATPLFIIVPAIIAPILEEIVFRKVIFGSLYKKMNFFLAGLLSAIIFGFIHGEPEHILIYATMGFTFAFLYVKTKRILVPIIAHAAMNTSVVIAQYSMTPEEIQQQLDTMQTIIGG